HLREYHRISHGIRLPQHTDLTSSLIAGAILASALLGVLLTRSILAQLGGEPAHVAKSVASSKWLGNSAL
ncbi:hypothetical protein, partial [Serratia marcescens]|uniref:hypothetical protein n=1 Tax=Serratia marcescens TaxID=615 RepID=UPI001954AABB